MADASALGEESLCSPLVDASASIDRGAIWINFYLISTGDLFQFFLFQISHKDRYNYLFGNVTIRLKIKKFSVKSYLIILRSSFKCLKRLLIHFYILTLDTTQSFDRLVHSLFGCRTVE